MGLQDVVDLYCINDRCYERRTIGTAVNFAYVDDMHFVCDDFKNFFYRAKNAGSLALSRVITSPLEEPGSRAC